MPDPQSQLGARTLSCPLCGGGTRRWMGNEAREIRRCTACRFRWIPQGVKRSATGASLYDDERSVFFGEGAADYYLDDTAREAAEAKLQWVTRYVQPPGRLLDVGANVGHFCAAASRQFETLGIEPNVHAVRWARERLAAPVEPGSVHDDRPAFHARFDAVTLFDVLEHVPDPHGALARCRSWLNERGRLFITTPDAGSVPARLLGRHWYYVDLEEHVSLFTAENLHGLLERTGFRVLARRTIGRRYRFSYIERRLAYLAKTAAGMRLAHAAAQPLRLFPRGAISLNLGDVVGLVAEPRR